MALLLGVAVVYLGEGGRRRVGREVGLDDLIEPGVVLTDGVPDLDHRDTAVFHDGVVSYKAVGLALRRHGSRGDLVVHVGGHTRRMMPLEDSHCCLSLGPGIPGPDMLA